MARRKMNDKLILRETIQEELRLIKDSETDYITPTGKIYKDYGNNMMYPKTNFINKNNGYLYWGITYPDGQRQRRVHILVAEVYLPNPNVENLQWGTVSQNTKSSFDDGLQVNDKSWNDSQSVHVCAFDLSQNLLNKYGSISEASRQLGVTKTTILNQCNHGVKTKPRCGYYFRYLSEYEANGFVL